MTKGAKSPIENIEEEGTKVRDVEEGEMKNQSRKPGLKRYNLSVPDSIYEEVQILAEKQHTSVIDLLRRFIRLGLLITKLMDNPDTELIIRNGEKERQLVLFN